MFCPGNTKFAERINKVLILDIESITAIIEDLKKEKPNKNKPSILINEEQPLHEVIVNFKNECKTIHELIIKNKI